MIRPLRVLPASVHQCCFVPLVGIQAEILIGHVPIIIIGTQPGRYRGRRLGRFDAVVACVRERLKHGCCDTMTELDAIRVTRGGRLKVSSKRPQVIRVTVRLVLRDKIVVFSVPMSYSGWTDS